MRITQRPFKDLLARFAWANRPQLWFWLAAICFVVSTSLFWHRSLSVDATDQTALEDDSQMLPVLDEAHVVTQPRLYPASYSNRPRPTNHDGVQRVAGEHPATDGASEVVHAAWRTDDPNRQRRVERVSVKSVEVDRPAPAWLSGSIEIMQPGPAATLAPAREPAPAPEAHPLRPIQQAAAYAEDAPARRVTPANVTAQAPAPMPSLKPRESARPAGKPAPASDLPTIIPARRK